LLPSILITNVLAASIAYRGRAVRRLCEGRQCVGEHVYVGNE
jgi:hypothetical protein